TVRGVSSVLWPFTQNDLGQASGSGHFYRPLWVLVNAGIYQLSHTPLTAHVLNLVLFALICAEVVLLLWRFTGAQGALVGGLLFAVFPSHGESVAWISGNTDLLAVGLGLAAVLVALGGSGVVPTAGAGVLAAAAMLAKEVAVIFPLLAA